MADLLDALKEAGSLGLETSEAEATELKEHLEQEGIGTVRYSNGRAYAVLLDDMRPENGGSGLCTACKLSKPGQVSYRGPVEAEMVIVGESPGQEEQARGIPFIGPAGRELQAALRHAGLDESKILITNAIRCVPDRKLQKEEITTCSRLFLHRLLRMHPRRLILALGNVACFALHPEWGLSGIKARRGTPVWSDRWDCYILPIIHPASMLKREPDALAIRTFAGDIARAKALKDRSYQMDQPTVSVSVLSSVAQLESWRKKFEDASLIAVDVETTGRSHRKDRVISIALSPGPHEALTIPIEARLVALTTSKKSLKDLDYDDTAPAGVKSLGSKVVRYSDVCAMPGFEPTKHAKYLRPSGFVCYWSANEWKRIWEFLHYVLCDLDVPKTMQNGTFDYKMLHYQYGFDIRPWKHDTIVLHQLLDENAQHGLDAMAADALGYISHKDPVRDVYRSVCKAWKMPVTCGDYSLVPPKLLHEYNGQDTGVQHELTTTLLDQLASIDGKMPLYYQKLTMPIWTELVLPMELRGLHLDRKSMDYADQVLLAAVDKAKSQLVEFSGDKDFNPNSPKQLAKLLYKDLRLPVVNRTSGGDPSTDEATLSELEKFESRVIKVIRRFRSLSKLHGSFVKKLRSLAVEPEFKVYPQYSIAADHSWLTQEEVSAHGTTTGRLSARDPAIQTIPKSLRPLFWAGPGRVFIECDYSTLELRVWAALSGDKELQRVVSAEDVHREIAANIFGVAPEEISSEQRSIGKTFAFGAAYGAEAPTLAARAGIEEQQAEVILKALKSAFPIAFEWMRQAGVQAVERGYVETFMGRRRRPAGVVCADERLRAAAMRQAGNSPVQGTGFECCSVGWLKTERALKKAGLDCHSEIHVHDSVVFNAAEDCADQAVEVIRENMTDPLPLGVHLPVHIGDEKDGGPLYWPTWCGNLNLDPLVEEEDDEQ